jgi:hypothetical protein
VPKRTQEILIVTFFVEMYNWLNFIDYINTILINIQPLWGWYVGDTFPQVAPVAIHIQPLWGWHVGDTFPTGCTYGYLHSTPLGLAL